VDEHIGWRDIAEFGAELMAVGGIGDDDAVRLAGQASGRFIRGNEGGDVPPGGGKKIRASFAGVATAGEEDARS
jgi:hypothetical protein